MRLDVMSYGDVQDSRIWRNKHLETLRTPYYIPYGMQIKFWEDIICNRKSEHRYWALKEKRKELGKDCNFVDSTGHNLQDVEEFVGVGGLTNISWENRNAEISLIIDDKYQRMGLGKKAVQLLLDQGFNYMNLENIYGEVYYCNELGVEFWKKMIKKYTGESVIKPRVKYYKGKYWDSLYFNFYKMGVIMV